MEEKEEVACKKEQYIRNQSASQKSVPGLVDYCKEPCQPGLALPARRESKTHTFIALFRHSHCRIGGQETHTTEHLGTPCLVYLNVNIIQLCAYT